MDIAVALEQCGITEGWKVEDPISNETEFNQYFYRKTGTDDSGTVIWSNEQSDFGVTWAELESAWASYTNPKISGNQKLLDLGLTQAEATALTGYTPPEE